MDLTLSDSAGAENHRHKVLESVEMVQTTETGQSSSQFNRIHNYASLTGWGMTKTNSGSAQTLTPDHEDLDAV